jgi:hypothetical protein
MLSGYSHQRPDGIAPRQRVEEVPQQEGTSSEVQAEGGWKDSVVLAPLAAAGAGAIGLANIDAGFQPGRVGPARSPGGE